jgi:hypothetical protein
MATLYDRFLAQTAQPQLAIVPQHLVQHELNGACADTCDEGWQAGTSITTTVDESLPSVLTRDGGCLGYGTTLF